MFQTVCGSKIVACERSVFILGGGINYNNSRETRLAANHADLSRFKTWNYHFLFVDVIQYFDFVS